MTAIKQTVTALESALAELAERAQRQAAALERVTARAEELEQRLARGTADHTADLLTAEWSPIPTKVTPAKRAPTPPPAPARDLRAELEAALRARPSSLTELARTLHVPVNHVVIALRGLRKAGRVYNVGTAEAPRWTWVVGDDGPMPELAATVEALIRDRPMTFAELLAATGARRGRVSGVIVALQRGGAAIENRGDPRRARWFLPR